MPIKFSDRSVRDFRGLYQWPTYTGVLEGVPNAEMNKSLIDGILGKAKELTHSEHIFLIEPRLEPMENQGSFSSGEFEKLPGIVCVANLLEQAIKDQYMFSSLTLVWFQDEYAMPIGKEIEKQIEELDWTKIAKDFDL